MTGFYDFCMQQAQTRKAFVPFLSGIGLPYDYDVINIKTAKTILVNSADVSNLMIFYSANAFVRLVGNLMHVGGHREWSTWQKMGNETCDTFF